MLTPLETSGTAVNSGLEKKRDSTDFVSPQPGLVGSSTAPSLKCTRSATGTYWTVVVTSDFVGSVPTIWKTYVLWSNGDVTLFWKNGIVTLAFACAPSIWKFTLRGGTYQNTG